MSRREEPVMAAVKPLPETDPGEDGLLDLIGLSKEDLTFAGVTWRDLWDIGSDYEARKQRDHYDEVARLCGEELASIPEVHFVSHRIKDTAGLLEKIVRKRMLYHHNIDIDNYLYEIEDLLGIRLIHVFRNDYLPIHEHLHHIYERHVLSEISVKLRKGDDDSAVKALKSIYGNHVKHEEGEAYRSIHCVVDPVEAFRSMGVEDEVPRLEIQTRSIFEEGWSEISHRLVYKGSEEPNQILATYSVILSQLVGVSDGIGSLMRDKYDKLHADSQPRNAHESDSKEDKASSEPVQIEAVTNEMIDALFDTFF